MIDPALNQAANVDSWTFRSHDEEAHPYLSDQDLAAAKKAFLDGLHEEEDVWFFGYGSLMWNPGFPSLADGVAVTHGWQRRFCMWSTDYRGTPRQPGLVLGLDEGGSCTGRAYQVSRGQVHEVADYLWEREMNTGMYQAVLIDAEVEGHGHRACWAFVVRRDHSQYAADLSEEDCAMLIGKAVGNRGSNREYLKNTLQHLADIGVEDEHLREIAVRIDVELVAEHF